MRVNVMLFGQLADAIGLSKLEVKNISDTEMLRTRLIKEFPKLEKHKFVMAVYKTLADGSKKLSNGDTVALLPPFSGG